jgi:hypothetical protein
MNKAMNTDPTALKKFAFTLAIVTFGLSVAATIFYQIEFSVFPFGWIISYSVAPVLLNCWIMFVDDEKKKQWAAHNICGILMYIWFGGWSIFGAWNIISFFINFISFLGNISYILLLATQISYTLVGLIGLVYYHQIKSGLQAGGELLQH